VLAVGDDLLPLHPCREAYEAQGSKCALEESSVTARENFTGFLIQKDRLSAAFS